WSFEGLRASDADNPRGGNFFQAGNSDHINFRRNLLSNSNRRVNQAMIGYVRSQYGLAEENELYNYTRHGIMLAGASNVTVRRNYANSRDYPSAGAIPGIPASGDAGGDSGVVIYPGSNNLVENNISERNLSGVNIQAAGYGGTPSSNNRFFGDISLNDVNSGGVRMISRGDGLLRMPQNTYFENQVVIGAKAIGAWFRGNKNSVCQNCSVLNSKTHGFAADPTGPGDGAPTVYIQNSLAYGNSRSGFLFVGQADFGVKNSNSFGNGSNYTPGSSSKYSNAMSRDPQLGSCKVFIPGSSPMKGAGTDGNDIGANVLCRYENGVLTQTQLWNWSTGQFPCGAIVAGVNDKPGESCFDVNKRLNVNANGCTLPANPICKQPAPPADFPPLTGLPGSAPVFYSPDGKVCPSGYQPLSNR
ncbi:MAG TPA: right-handed parallel beta-helix repeat-containing protein, partial [Chryseosolibacter sp.]|nr:right-handed parallel beta-helix repeat-containing protein [Chryseosolibacter sp.]